MPFLPVPNSPPRLRARTALLWALLVLVLVPATAPAALPAKRGSFEAHDHVTPGRNWHVQLEISARSSRAIETLVVYSEKCGITDAVSGVPISAAGVVATTGTAGGGAWRLEAVFTAPDAVQGTFRMTKGACDTGPLPFRVVPKGAGDGHAGHTHGAGGGHAHGAKYPAIDGASAKHVRQAIRMRHQALAVAAERFPTYRAARRRGFERFEGEWQRPLLFHLRSRHNLRDDRILDPRHPESLVYWWPAEGDPVLVALMFSVPAGSRPAFAGPIPIYHQHPSAHGGLGATAMTHVWLTGDLRSAWANCFPVLELQWANPAFRYAPPPGHAGPAPCEPPPWPLHPPETR